MNTDHSIFINEAGVNGLIVSTFIYNIKIIFPKESGHISRIKAKSATTFFMVHMGPISCYLGLKIQ